MSGVCAIAHNDDGGVDPAALYGMLERLSPRGAGTHAWMGGSVGLGHAAFDVADGVDACVQPMTLDGEVYVAADAWIVGRDELRRALRAHGFSLKAETPDAQLILASYLAWGAACPARLLGDFAFVIWDARRGHLFGARDRLGHKVLYYSAQRDRLLVGNALAAIRSHPDVSDRLDDLAIGDFLLFGQLVRLDKSRTAYADVRRLPPAHAFRWSRDGFTIRRYWSFPVANEPLRYKDARSYGEHFRYVMRTAVKDCLRGKRTVISLSGGLDSTTIAAIAADLRDTAEITSELTAVTCTYDRVHEEDEGPLAQSVAEELHIPSKLFPCDGYRPLSPFIPSDEPTEDLTPACSLDMIETCMGLGRVVLSGTGADELFLPPPTLASALAHRCGGRARTLTEWLMLWRRYGTTLPLGTGLRSRMRALVRPRWALSDAPTSSPYWAYPPWIAPAFEERCQLRERWEATWAWRPEPAHPYHPLPHLWLSLLEWRTDLTYAPAGAAPLPEMRYPFQDARVIDFVLSVPALPWFFKKHLIREAMGGALPRRVLTRPKTPLGDLTRSLLQDADAQQIDGWKPHHDLLSYVDRRAIPVLTSRDAPNAWPHLLPLLLNEWLQAHNRR